MEMSITPDGLATVGFGLFMGKEVPFKNNGNRRFDHLQLRRDSENALKLCIRVNLIARTWGGNVSIFGVYSRF